MIFEFLKYINPLWYYNLSVKDCKIPYFINYKTLTDTELSILDIDENYKSEESKLYDAAYQGWQKGIINTDSAKGLTSRQTIKNKYRKIQIVKIFFVEITDSTSVKNIDDNYRFIKRFFNPIWSIYILIIRLISFHNPIKELKGFFRSISVKRINPYKNNNYQNYKIKYEKFDSPLIKRQPFISVIIPTLNRYQYLKDVLLDLQKQKYKNFEVIIVDQSDPLDKEFYDNWNLDIKLICQKEKALWFARNRAIKESQGEYILLYDDDSLIEDDWIIQHLKCLDYFQCDISSGVSISVAGAEVPANYSYFRWGDQIDTGNVMFKKEIMEITGMFDRQFEKQRQGDGEYGLRCYLSGLTNISNNFAKRIHLKAEAGGLRQVGSWDGLRPTKIFAPRPVPSILYLARKYFGSHLARLMLLSSIPGSIIPYKFKRNKAIMILGYILGIIMSPVILLQVFISWRKSGIKLKEGSKIETLS